jgi:hypothetical protein
VWRGQTMHADAGAARAFGGEEEGQGLCPWTKLGTSPQTPFV